LKRWKNTVVGVKKTYPDGSDMPAFEYKQAEEIRDALKRRGVRYLFIGKSGAILLGFPDTTQDADLFVENSLANNRALVRALRELGFSLTDDEAAEVERGKDFVQLRSGPFDLDLVFAPDGIERFADAWKRRVEVEGFPVCHIDDIIASKQAANRERDREALPRLRAFREYWLEKRQQSE
jgi:hypothetical protein